MHRCEIRTDHSRWRGRRAARIARRPHAACTPPTRRRWMPSRASGVVGRANHVPPSLPAGLGCRLPQPAGLRSAGSISPAGAPLEAAAQGIELGPERLGRPLQSGDDRRPDDARLHRRSHLDRRSPRAAGRRSGTAWAATRCNSFRASVTAICWSAAAIAIRRRFPPTRAPLRRTI